MQTNETPQAGNGQQPGPVITRPIMPTGPDPGSDVATRWYVVVDVESLEESGHRTTLPVAGPYQAHEQAEAARDRLLAAHPTARIARHVYEHFPEPEPAPQVEAEAESPLRKIVCEVDNLASVAEMIADRACGNDRQIEGAAYLLAARLAATVEQLSELDLQPATRGAA